MSEALGSETRIDSRAGQLLIHYGDNLGVLDGVLERLGLHVGEWERRVRTASADAIESRSRRGRALGGSGREVCDSACGKKPKGRSSLRSSCSLGTPSNALHFLLDTA